MVGGAVVAAVRLLTGAGGCEETTTVLWADVASPKEGALTPREIYTRDALGVLFRTASVTQAPSSSPEQEGRRSGRAT